MERTIESVKAEAQGLQEQLTSWRHLFHRIPETGFAEFETTKELCRILTEMGPLPLKVGVAGIETGVVVDIDGARPGRCVALRADIDGLAIEEENDVPYRSQHPGRMHACGHDGHMAMLLGAAKILWARRGDFAGRVRLIFQPCEEIGDGGSRPMIADGVLDGVDAISGIHLWQSVESGAIAYNPRAAMASSDTFVITVQGRGGHGAMPHETVDPIVAASALVCGLQPIVSREVDAQDTAVITVGKFVAGTGCNVVPETALLEGTIRALSPETRDRLIEAIRRVARCESEAHRCTATVEIKDSCVAVRNDPDFLRNALAVAERIVGPERVREIKSTMGGDDVGFYLERVPGCYLFLGIGNEGKGLTHPHHNAKFDVDDDVLHIGTALHAAVALDFLSK